MTELSYSLGLKGTVSLVIYVLLMSSDLYASATTRYIPSAAASPLAAPELAPSFLMSALFPKDRDSTALQHNSLPHSSAEGKKMSPTLSSFPSFMSSQMSQRASEKPPVSLDESSLSADPSSEKSSKVSKKRRTKSIFKALHKDLIRLSRLLPGVYTNTRQYRQEGGKQLPMDKRHILLRSSYRAVRLGFLPRAFAVLVQDYTNDSLFPFRQRVHTFSVDLAHRAIRMKVWNFATNRTEKMATRNLAYFRKLRRKDLVSQGACDMFWRRLNKKTFVGITGKECLGYVRGEKVRITVSTTLTSHLLQTNEGWYRARDGKKLVEIDVPYNLVRTKSFYDKRSKSYRSLTSSPTHQQAAQNDLPTQSSPVDKRETFDEHPHAEEGRKITGSSNDDDLNEKPLPKRKEKDPDDDEDSDEDDSTSKYAKWVLPDFKSIVKALHSGQTVFYSVELSACSLPAQHKVERMSFGDFVDGFESFFGGSRKDKATVRVWQSKFVQGLDGVEQLTRELTVKDNGRVSVRIHRKRPGTNEITQDHEAQCKLFDPTTGLGGVRLTARPSENVQEIATFGRFRSSLRRGRRQVRMLVDLNQCEGRTRGVKAIMGFTVRAYDFMNQGKAIEITQLTPEQESTHRKMLTGHFLQNGEVVFITSFLPGNEKDDFQHVQLLHQDATYRCALSGSDISKNRGPWGVRLFYT